MTNDDEKCEYNDDYTSKLESINNVFKIPMHYNSQKRPIHSNIKEDLELLTTVDSSCSPIYDYFIFNEPTPEKNVVNSKIIEQISENYTTDVDYLKEQQQLLQNYKHIEGKSKPIQNTSIISLLDEIKLNLSFKDKYGFIDYEMFDYLNKSQIFLTGLSLYNIISPLMSLMIPIFIVIIPFFIIKIKGYKVSIQQYIEILKQTASNNSLYKLFTNFNSVDTTQKMYLLISAGFYVFSIYQNVVSCFKFHQNMKNIHNYFDSISSYLDYTKHNIQNFLTFSDSLPTLFLFNETLKSKLKHIEYLYKKIICVSKYELTNYKKISELGYVMKLFYEIYENDEINDTLLYAIGFNSYSDIMDNISCNLKNGSIHCVKLQRKSDYMKKKKHKNKDDDDDDDKDKDNDEDEDNKEHQKKYKFKNNMNKSY